MSVLLGKDTRVIVQGLGREGRFHAGRMKEYGTRVVGGTKPGAGGTSVDGIPLFDTVAQAVDETGANASIVLVRRRAGWARSPTAADARSVSGSAIPGEVPIAARPRAAPVDRRRPRTRR